MPEDRGCPAAVTRPASGCLRKACRRTTGTRTRSSNGLASFCISPQPEFLIGRDAVDDDDVLRLRQNAQDAYRTEPAKSCFTATTVSFSVRLWKRMRRCSTAVITIGTAGKRRLRCRCTKLARGRTDADDEVRRMLCVERAQILDKRCFRILVARPRRRERMVLDIQRPARLPGQLGPYRPGVFAPRPEILAKGVKDHHPLGFRLGGLRARLQRTMTADNSRHRRQITRIRCSSRFTIGARRFNCPRRPAARAKQGHSSTIQRARKPSRSARSPASSA